MSNVNTYEEYHLNLLGVDEPLIFGSVEDVISFMQENTTPGTLKKVIFTESTIMTFNAGQPTPKADKKTFKDFPQIGKYKVKEG